MDKSEAFKKILSAKIRVIMQGDKTLAYKKSDILYTADGTLVADLRQAKENGQIQIAHIKDMIYIGEKHDNSIENGCLTDESGHVFARSERYSRIEEIVMGSHGESVVDMDEALYLSLNEVYKKSIKTEFQKVLDTVNAEHTMYGHLEELDMSVNKEIDEDNLAYADIAREKFVVDYVVIYNAYDTNMIVMTDKKMTFNGKEIKETIDEKIGGLEVLLAKENNVYVLLIKDKEFNRSDKIITTRYAKVRTDDIISMHRTIMKVSTIKGDEKELGDERVYASEVEGEVYTELGYMDVRYINGGYIDICIEEND